MQESFFIKYKDKSALLSRLADNAWYVFQSGKSKKIKIASVRVDTASAQSLAKQWLKNNFSKI